MARTSSPWSVQLVSRGFAANYVGINYDVRRVTFRPGSECGESRLQGALFFSFTLVLMATLRR
jgi:hypothetical protein